MSGLQKEDNERFAAFREKAIRALYFAEMEEKLDELYRFFIRTFGQYHAS